MQRSGQFMHQKTIMSQSTKNIFITANTGIDHELYKFKSHVNKYRCGNGFVTVHSWEDFCNKQTILILDDKQFIYASQVVELHDILGTYVNPYWK